MHYAILIYQAEGAQDHFTDDERAQVVSDHRDLKADMTRAGAYMGAVQLMGGHTATTVRTVGSSVSLADGPYVESKELLGFYLVECSDLDTATGYAARLPESKFGATEVRPIVFAADRTGSTSE
ncbi:MAG: YciI family protein [Myxococcota bacterium]